MSYDICKNRLYQSVAFLCFHKKNIRSSQLNAIINYKKSYPSFINKQFKKRKIDAAFISSIASRGEKGLNVGIVAKNDVLSVLCILGEPKEDFESGFRKTVQWYLNNRNWWEAILDGSYQLERLGNS